MSSLFAQSAFKARPLSLSLPVIDTAEPVSPVVLAEERRESRPAEVKDAAL